MRTWLWAINILVLTAAGCHSGMSYKMTDTFEKGRLFRFRTFTDFDIVLKDSILTLSRYMGNPEKEEILQFRKSHQQ